MACMAIDRRLGEQEPLIRRETCAGQAVQADLSVRGSAGQPVTERETAMLDGRSPRSGHVGVEWAVPGRAACMLLWGHGVASG